MFYINAGFSQENKSDIKPTGLKKNVIYGTLGIDVSETYGTIMANYERMILELPNSFVQSFWVRVGAGPWVWWTGKGWHYASTLSALTGRKSVHFEFGGGILFTYDSHYEKFHPLIGDRHLAGNLGFRYQKPGGTFIFRTGIGWPEYMYLSLGYCF